MTSTPTKPVDNVVIATKGLQDRNTNVIAVTTVENKGKLILSIIDALKRLVLLLYSSHSSSGSLCAPECFVTALVDGMSALRGLLHRRSIICEGGEKIMLTSSLECHLLWHYSIAQC